MTSASGSSPSEVASEGVRHEFVFESAPTEQCHAPTLAYAGDALVAAWFGGSREGAADVDIWMARRESGVWSRPRRVATGEGPDGRSWSCWNPVLYGHGDHRVELFYKVGPSPRRWWGMRTLSLDAGCSWRVPERLPAGYLGPVKNKPLRQDDGRLLCGASREGVGWRVHLEWLPAAGDVRSVGYEQTPPLNRGLWLRAIQPALLRHRDGRLQMLCRTRSGRVAESWSADGGRRWSALRLTALPDAASGLDAVTLADGRHLVVYNHSHRRSPLNVAVSEDGREWQAAAVLEAGEGEFSYPSVIQSVGGRIHVAYTWRRERIRLAELDLERLRLRPIRDGRWPSEGAS